MASQTLAHLRRRSVDDSDPSRVTAYKGPPVSKNVPAYVKMVAGMAAGVTEACCLQPLDVAKTRLQLDNQGKYRGLVHCTKTIAKEEGVRSLYKGLTPFVTHLTLKYALRFGSFGFFKKSLTRDPHSQNEAAINFSAGLLSGLTEAVLIVTPFEVVKTRLQKQKGLKHLKYKGPIHCAMTMAKEEGVLALWNGCIPTMLRQGTNQAFNFMAFSFLQRHVFGRVEGDAQDQAMWKPFVTGLVASTIGPLMNCPLDVVKTRLMAQDNTNARRYNGWIDCAKTIAKEEGMAALWKGIVPRLARLAPGQAITWTVVTNVQTWFEKRLNLQNERKNWGTQQKT